MMLMIVPMQILDQPIKDSDGLVVSEMDLIESTGGVSAS